MTEQVFGDALKMHPSDLEGCDAALDAWSELCIICTKLIVAGAIGMM